MWEENGPQSENKFPKKLQQEKQLKQNMGQKEKQKLTGQHKYVETNKVLTR